jgi:hypothetical protein
VRVALDYFMKRFTHLLKKDFLGYLPILAVLVVVILMALELDSLYRNIKALLER